MRELNLRAVPSSSPEAAPVSRIRGPKLSPFIAKSKGVPFEEGLAKAEAAGKTIASFARFGRIADHSDEAHELFEVFQSWTGTIFAYIEPRKALGPVIESTDARNRWVVHVPEHYREAKDAVLFVDHPEYTIERDGRNRVVHASSFNLVSDFASITGWLPTDPKHGIPVGDRNASYSHPGARFLWREKTMVGPASVGLGLWRYLYLADSPSSKFGMAVEAPPPELRLVK